MAMADQEITSLAPQQEVTPNDQKLTVKDKESLKYLEFIQLGVIQALIALLSLYEKAKEKSGPLKAGVETVEGTVKCVVGPVLEKYHDLPVEVLKYFDEKVGATIAQIDNRVPSAVIQASAQAISAAQVAPVIARAVATEVKRAGLKDTASGFGKAVYTKYEPKAELCAASAWRKLNQVPLFPRLAQAVLPTAAYCSEKYNSRVISAAENGSRVSSYLPLVPTGEIARIFGDEKKEL